MCCCPGSPPPWWWWWWWRWRRRRRLLVMANLTTASVQGPPPGPELSSRALSSLPTVTPPPSGPPPTALTPLPPALHSPHCLCLRREGVPAPQLKQLQVVLRQGATISAAELVSLTARLRFSRTIPHLDPSAISSALPIPPPKSTSSHCTTWPPPSLPPGSCAGSDGTSVEARSLAGKVVAVYFSAIGVRLASTPKLVRLYRELHDRHPGITTEVPPGGKGVGVAVAGGGDDTAWAQWA